MCCLLALYFPVRTMAQDTDSTKTLSKDQGIVFSTDKLDFKLSGGIYLYDYAPFMKNSKNNFSIYAFILKIDAATKDQRYGLHMETRSRDTKLRPFYHSVIWFQEAYAFARTKVGDVHVGKFYKKVGLFWDDSFWGNIQYFNGLKLNPEFGAELIGTKKTGSQTKIGYSLQYINNNDHVDGALEGRDVESDTNAVFQYGVTARIAPTFQLTSAASLTVGASGLTGMIRRTKGVSFRLSQIAADATLNIGKGTLFGEILHQWGEKDNTYHPLSRLGYDNVTYYLAGARYLFLKKLLLRISYSQANYQGAKSVERELLPGVVYHIRDNLAVIVEYDHWKLKPKNLPVTTIDESLNFVIHYNF